MTTMHYRILDSAFSSTKIKIRRFWSSLVGNVLLSGVELDIMEVEVLIDCKTVLKIFSHPEDWSAFLSYHEDFIRLSSLFSLFSLSVVPRQLNHKADSLARLVRKNVCGPMFPP